MTASCHYLDLDSSRIQMDVLGRTPAAPFLSRAADCSPMRESHLQQVILDYAFLVGLIDLCVFGGSMRSTECHSIVL